MSLFQLSWVMLILGVGFLVWRGSRNLWSAVLAGLVLPTFAIVIFVSVVGRDALEGASPLIFLFGTIITLLVLAYAFRK